MTSKAEILTKLQYQLGIEVMAEQTYQMAKEKISDPKIRHTK